MTSWRSENFISGGRFQNPSFSFLPRTLVLDRRVRIIVEDFQFFPPRLEGGNGMLKRFLFYKVICLHCIFSFENYCFN